MQLDSQKFRNRRSNLLIAMAGLGAVAFSSLSALLAQEKLPTDGTYSRGTLLNQGWSDEDRLRYYFTTQGSAAISYDIFLNLEQAENQFLFRSNENLARFGLIPYPVDPKFNPDGLPIGITKTVVHDGRWKGEWVGMGCAACHNGQLHYKGTTISISGGNNAQIDIDIFITALSRALQATAADDEKFNRLANRLNRNSDADKDELRNRLSVQAAEVERYAKRSMLGATPGGPGRMDALTLIHNRIADTLLDIPENWSALVAPAKPSSAWNMPQSAFVQWLATTNDPLVRNAGESLGVFVKADLTSSTPADGLFDSTMDLKGQFESEALLRRLAPPQWPEKILGKLDRSKVAQGEKLFRENCAGCHSTWPHRWSEPRLEGKRFIENAVIPHSMIGTDPMQLATPVANTNPVFMTGSLAEYLRAPNQGQKLAAGHVLFEASTRMVFERALDKLQLSDAELMAARGYQPVYPASVGPRPPLGVYKAAPIDGLWANAPYLHNGSVPNLYELLSPAKERSKRFFIGQEFDPVKLGVDTSGASGKYLFDTTRFANSNSGHSFEDGPSGSGIIGRKLTEEERWALIEYVKSRPDQAGQITPFGGPKDAVSAWQDPTFFNVINPEIYNAAPK
ncbi:di-heme-cytochrome C peroxidase [Brucella intermedia]|uniref:di-heme-cytochrome C peroxidase n=1 Tax=Brucella intermedia TaxID=94625 RepID=UPI00124C117B|nr:di-heme-cytochrome C peroxidase [Brucella intermedia]KAB2723341.1 hypothetical protein F9L02_22395 [Brucella intermedia]